MKKHVLQKAEEAASYCCEAAEVVSAETLPREDAFNLKRTLDQGSESASYCCEASGAIQAKKLPKEDAF